MRFLFNIEVKSALRSQRCLTTCRKDFGYQ